MWSIGVSFDPDRHYSWRAYSQTLPPENPALPPKKMQQESPPIGEIWRKATSLNILKRSNLFGRWQENRQTVKKSMPHNCKPLVQSVHQLTGFVALFSLLSAKWVDSLLSCQTNYEIYSLPTIDISSTAEIKAALKFRRDLIVRSHFQGQRGKIAHNMQWTK